MTNLLFFSVIKQQLVSFRSYTFTIQIDNSQIQWAKKYSRTPNPLDKKFSSWTSPPFNKIFICRSNDPKSPRSREARRGRVSRPLQDPKNPKKREEGEDEVLVSMRKQR